MTSKKASLIGLTLTAIGISVLFINKLYTASCEMPCGYLGDTRSIVINIGIGLVVLGVVFLVYSVARLVMSASKADEQEEIESIDQF